MAEQNAPVRCALAIMARTPEKFKTKTRLAKTMGHDAALDAHVELVMSTLERLNPSVIASSPRQTNATSELDVSVSLWVTQENSVCQEWADTFDMPLRGQQPGQLGERMLNIIETLHGQGFQRICLVGSDCPSIDGAYILEAFAALAEADVVFGPAEDGGYGLIGMGQPQQSLFEGIDWGTEYVFAQSQQAAASAGLSSTSLAQIWDIDVYEDWVRFKAL